MAKYDKNGTVKFNRLQKQKIVYDCSLNIFGYKKNVNIHL